MRGKGRGVSPIKGHVKKSPPKTHASKTQAFKTKPTSSKQNKKAAANQAARAEQQAVQRDPITLGFIRGVAPDKWASRWREVPSRGPLELMPIGYHVNTQTHTRSLAEECDLVIMRVAEGEVPAGSGSAQIHTPKSHHAVSLYTEQLGLVVPREHELSKQAEVTQDDLELLGPLIDYAGYDTRWPTTMQWADESYRPNDLREAITLVGTGLGATLAPLPLARTLINKKEHTVVLVNASLPSATVFAAWQVARDGNDIQELIGVLRGRRSNSSR